MGLSVLWSTHDRANVNFFWFPFSTDPTVNPSLYGQYRAQLPINGNVGQSGFSLVLDQANSDLFPTQYFTVEAVNNQGAYIRLIRPLDRDVSIF